MALNLCVILRFYKSFASLSQVYIVCFMGLWFKVGLCFSFKHRLQVMLLVVLGTDFSPIMFKDKSVRFLHNP